MVQSNISLATALMLLLCAARQSHSGGIDFDLNEPPPEKYLEHEHAQEVQEESQLQLEPLFCPGPKAAEASLMGGNKFQRDRNSAMSLRERFEKLIKLRKATESKELPDYCDYEKFKAMHSNELKEETKHESDVGEQLFRRSLYLKRCLDVFRSRVEYRLGKKTYLEGLTPLADLSPNEVGQLFMSAPPMEFSRRQTQDMAELHKQRRALKENDLELPSQSTLNGDDDDDEAAELARMANKLATGDSFAQDRLLVMDSGSVRSMIAVMLDRSPGDDFESTADREEYKLAIREELTGAELSHKSEACANFDEAGHRLAAYPTDRWPLSDKRPEGRDSGKLPDAEARASYVAPDLTEWERQYLDWSHHQCFHRVYKQFPNCGCCYVVAAVNLAEFVACTEQENQIDLRRFSEMHVLNCGLKYHAYNMGCSGGSVLETLRFIGRAGAYTRKAWRQRVEQSAKRKEFTDLRDMNCPMQPGRPWHEWGQDKLLLNPVVVHPNEWLHALEDGPLVATVQMPRDGIVTYSGGVHDGHTCEGSGIWHVMVLVGYGRDEHGLPYWRFRNSFGPKWGDQGHFNLAMSVPGECFAGGVRVYREPVQE